MNNNYQFEDEHVPIIYDETVAIFLMSDSQFEKFKKIGAFNVKCEIEALFKKGHDYDTALPLVLGE